LITGGRLTVGQRTTITAFALSSAVYIAANASGGHVNPAVTFGMAVGGRINVPTALFYWISQMLASVMACIFLKVATVGQVIKSALS
jgi:aquaporin TIP